MDLEIEAMIDVEVWMMDAPELFEEDQAWVAKETRASGIAFSEDQPPADVEVLRCRRCSSILPCQEGLRLKHAGDFARPKFNLDACRIRP